MIKLYLTSVTFFDHFIVISSLAIVPEVVQRDILLILLSLVNLAI